jgi:transposase
MAVVPKTSRREVKPHVRSVILDRYRQGQSVPQIIAATNKARSTIISIIDRYKDEAEPTFQNKPRSGRPPKLSTRAERRLLRHANANTKDTLEALATPSKSGKKICRTTVRKALKKYGKAKRRPRKKPWLHPENKVKRTDFCKEEKRVKRDYNKVCWSDEATFYVGEDGNIYYVTRGPGEEWEDKNLQSTFKSGRTSVGVWSCFCGDEMGPLVIIPK